MDDAVKTPLKAKRRRGGQPGNHNALKHGFYSRFFREGELVDLQRITEEGLDAELDLLRVLIRRMLEYTDGDKDMESSIRTITAVSVVTSRMANMLRVRNQVSRHAGEDKADPMKECLKIMDEKDKKR